MRLYVYAYVSSCRVNTLNSVLSSYIHIHMYIRMLLDPIERGYFFTKEKHWVCQAIVAYCKAFVKFLRLCSELDRLPYVHL